MSKAVFNSAPKVILPDGRAPLIVESAGIEVEFFNGEICVRSSKITRPPSQQPLSSAVSPAALKIGQVITADIATDPRNVGLKYAGRASKGLHLLVEPEDAMDKRGNRLNLTFGEAAKYAAGKGMEVPIIEDLDLLYHLADEIGGFDRSKSGWYMSASVLAIRDVHARIQKFDDGYQHYTTKNRGRFVRCVRRCSVI